VQLLPEDLRAIVMALRHILDSTNEDDLVNLDAVDIARQLERARRRQYEEG
jgi:ubiquitin-protein ligase